MKSTFLNKTVTALFIFCFAINAHAALNGTYTINPSAIATAVNYQNWISALNDLQGIARTDGGPMNGSGVSGAVIFNVAAGTYPGQIDINAITGVSAINTVTFDGDSAAACILLATSTPNPDYAVVRFNGCSYVTIKNFTITSTVPLTTGGTYGVHFLGTSAVTPCDNNTLKKCIINLTYIPGTGFNGQSIIGIVLSGNATSSTTGGYFSNNTVDSCVINNGYNSISANASSAVANGNVFKNNTCSNAYQRMIYLNTLSGTKVLNNTITSNSTYGINAGIALSYCNSSVTDFTEVSGNHVKSYSAYGILLSNTSGTTTLRTRVVNNFIGGALTNTSTATMRCLSLTNSNFTDIWNNSTNLNIPVTVVTNAAMYCDALSSNLDIRNNIFCYSATTGAGLPFYSLGTNTNMDAFDHNIFYNAASGDESFFASTTYTSATVIGGSGFNNSSFVTNPNYVSVTDFHIQNRYSGKIGITIAGFTKDIDNETRANPFLIGGDDFPSASVNDLSVSALISPSSPVNTGAQTITVKLTNVGVNIITNAIIHFKLNGVSNIPETWIGSLAAGASTNLTFTATGIFFLGKNVLEVFSTMPNGGVDSYTNNDTLKTILFTNLNGNYTLNSSFSGTLTNFNSFNAAAEALNGGTVTGPVKITVAPGIYNEQIELRAINGVSSANHVTFDGVDTFLVILSYSGSYGFQHTIKLSGCNYVTFKRMKITGTNTNYCWPIHFSTNNTNHMRFDRCAITVPSSTFDWNECPITFSHDNGYVTLFTMASVNVGYNEIDSCVLRGGRGGINFNGVVDSINCVNNKFRNNKITNVYSWGIWLNQSFGSKVLSNEISPNYNTGGGIFAYTCGNSFNDFTDISGNTITNFGYDISFGGNTDGGLYLNNCRGGSAGQFRISNNMVSGQLVNSNCMYVYLSKDLDILYNTFNYTQNSAAAYFAALQDFSYGPNVVKNNILAVTATSGSATPFYSNNGAGAYTAADFDYNIFYNTANTSAAYLSPNNYTLANVVGGGGFNVHSVVTDPNFVSATDLHITAQANLGITFSGITTDVDGEIRSNPPCIGADEINGCVLPANAQNIIGSDSICAGSTGVVFNIPTVTNATGYNWVVPVGATIVSGANTNSIVVDFSLAATNGIISVNGTNGCGDGIAATLEFYILQLPDAAGVISGSTSFCQGQTGVVFSVPAIPNSSSYNWSLPSGATIVGNANSNSIVVDFSSSSGIITVNGVNTCGNGSASQLAIEIHPLPTVTVTPLIDTICSGNSTVLIASGALTYSWSPSAGLDNSTNESVTASPVASTTYTITGIDANNCSATSQSSIIVVNCSGINPIAENAISIYPNPTTGKIILNFPSNHEIYEAAIYDLVGKLIDRISIGSNTENKFTYTFPADCSNGNYLLKMIGTNGIIVQKISLIKN